MQKFRWTAMSRSKGILAVSITTSAYPQESVMPGIFLLGPDVLYFVVDQLNEIAGLHETLALGVVFGDDIFFLHLLERLAPLLAGFDQGDAVPQHVAEFLDVGLG